jgi:hypothetical protein
MVGSFSSRRFERRNGNWAPSATRNGPACRCELQPAEHDWNYGSYVITHLLPLEVLVENHVRPER